MQITSLRSALAAAVLSGSLFFAPAAQAGSFAASVTFDLTLTSALPADVSLTYDNAVVFEDDSASNPPWSYYDASAVFIDDPASGLFGTLMTVQGDALGVRGSPLGEARSQRWTEGSVAIENASGAEVTLDFDYAYVIIAETFAQATGESTANAFARVELLWDGDFVAELVNAALDGVASDVRTGGGSLTLTIPAGETRTLSFLVDAGGDATHVPAPASLALIAGGLGLLGLQQAGSRRSRRRRG